ncbi:calcium-responsive transcription factor isoform X1 [Pygocentrus nattereri]|uniref:calcium-responsive transcription factor isoform X1 n=2 Tax=Pygocentrus nattereri TaxID=42514 RepID=UPI0008145046|nr:calcium-responsive transcription factor isoform X1 [Pygocentrus nattereri]XP_017547703.1 calcium-responsive transcription factor isoform X1 [Pygocentrus nattereri]XP_017547704.1 calcium-responsive transcription factor isoform X1 [Pygocentrus nattereri]XP_037395178.1 calcium-responsive transcription factor isoform X1 [Pygocentrus nattereri]
MEEQERIGGKACEFRQTGFSAAENSNVDKSTKPSESVTELELRKSTDTCFKEESSIIPVSENPASFQSSSAGPLGTSSVVIFDPNGLPLQCERMLCCSQVIGQSQNGQLYVIPSSQLGATRLLLPSCQVLNTADSRGTCIAKPSQEDKPSPAVTTGDVSTSTLTTVAPPSFTAIKTQTISSPDVFVPPVKPLPAAAPNWAKRLRRCEKIGDSYRGYCNTEAELEAVLLLHKQHTHSVFGTRQSPSPAKPATRLMWKSQYVPYDGIPFVNAGSRAIVMECQFGPRRKGVQPKKGTVEESNHNFPYKATCPARIYIKKVRKFPEYKVPVDPKVDKKVVRQEQEKAFFNLKKKLWDTGGVIRYYIQLPTQKAHLYHDLDIAVLPAPPEQPGFPEEDNEDEEDEEAQREEEENGEEENACSVPSRLHPLVAEKICELMAQGCNQVYAIRKHLRRFVEREMFKSDAVPERHNLCYFPTVNDIKNHMHEAQKSLQLPEGTMASLGSEWKTENENILTETVTLTLTPAPVNVNSQEEVLEGNDTLSPEAVQLFSSLTSVQPKIFAQLQGVQLHPAMCPPEGSLGQQPVSVAEPMDSSNPLNPHTLFLSPSSFLQSSSSAGEATAGPGPGAMLEMGQLVNHTEGDITQILLEDGQAIPVQIADPSSIALSASLDGALVEEGREVKPADISTEQSGDQG